MLGNYPCSVLINLRMVHSASHWPKARPRVALLDDWVKVQESDVVRNCTPNMHTPGEMVGRRAFLPCRLVHWRISVDQGA